MQNQYAIIAYLKKYEIFFPNKIRGLDGVNVMSGEINGLVGLFRILNKNIHTHCLAHVTQLVSNRS